MIRYSIEGLRSDKRKKTFFRKVYLTDNLVIKLSSQTILTAKEGNWTRAPYHNDGAPSSITWGGCQQNRICGIWAENLLHRSQRTCWPVLLTTGKMFGSHFWIFMMYTKAKVMWLLLRYCQITFGFNRDTLYCWKANTQESDRSKFICTWWNKFSQ